jgi:Shedu protein SduA, C-terminal
MKLINASEMPYPNDWPPEKYHAYHMDITVEQGEEFERLIEERVDETTIDRFLQKNKNVLVHCLRSFKTGHHGAWVIPQQQIRPPMEPLHKGLIPDYIIGGKSSDGFEWFVLELKGISPKLFAKSGKKLYLSSVLNMAICQTMEYIDYCASHQAYLRETFKLKNFREPKGLILIGREDELKLDQRRKTLKAAWNRYLGNKIEIRTYDSMLWHVREVIELKSKEK